jgi:hypothetical protein
MLTKFRNALKYLVNTKKRKVLRRWFRRKVSKMLRKLRRAMNNFFDSLYWFDHNNNDRYGRYFDQRYRKDQAFRDRFKGDDKPNRKVTSKLKDKSELEDKPTIEGKDKELKEKPRNEDKNKGEDKPKIKELTDKK